MEMPSYEMLMAFDGTEGLPDDEALERIAYLVDFSDILQKEEGTVRALEWCDALQARGIADATLATLEYFRANAWSNRTRLRNKNPVLTWAWEQPEIAQQILCLRKALNSPAFEVLPIIRRCQILTNLGNQLDAVGRFVEALEYWSRVLSILPAFWMAQGNRGYALLHYAKALHDRGHSTALLLSAHQDLVAALSFAAEHKELGYPEAATAFIEQKAYIETGINIEKATKTIKLDGYSLGESPEEQSYRRWCLAGRLFLNPLNDLGHSIGARDILTLPDFVTSIDEPPSLIGFFNQMKQEFVSARWLYYDGLHTHGLHFSDHDVLLYNTLDYPAYGLAVEKVKVATRMAYSLFDKIAFFLNAYMKLNMNPKRVSFRSIWRDGDKKNAPIRAEFEQSENWPFRGLYWLSKDILDEAFQDTPEPDGRELYEIRNHLEHKYLKVHEMLISKSVGEKAPTAWLMDDLAYSISRTEFSAKGLRVLKLARAALVYLSLGMHREEQRRAAKNKNTKVASMPLDPWDDKWKQ